MYLNTYYQFKNHNKNIVNTESFFKIKRIVSLLHTRHQKQHELSTDFLRYAWFDDNLLLIYVTLQNYTKITLSRKNISYN